MTLIKSSPPLGRIVEAIDEFRSESDDSRRRLLAASDAARRCIERDLHDGVQQELVSLSLEIAKMESNPPAEEALIEQLARVRARVDSILDSLVEIAHGIHPAILRHGGLGAALRSLTSRCAMPVEIRADVDLSLPEDVEVAGYYVVAEALTNVAKHARASAVRVDAKTGEGVLTMTIRDDGVGGARLGQGSGLIGLLDRVEALGGAFTVESPAGRGTSIVATLPIAAGRLDYRSSPVRQGVVHRWDG